MAALLEFLQEYVEQLGELTSPVKAKINSLTMLAAEEAAANPSAAPSIAAAIEKRINTAPANGKLPALFLLDSIAKNAKEPFIQIFSRNLPEVFLVAWETCLSDRSTLQRVLLTWDRVFPPQPLEAIRQRAGLAPSLASAPAPAAAAAGATETAAAAPQPATQPAAASAALSALQAALLGATAAARPPPMQREPPSLRPANPEQPAGSQLQQHQAPAAGAMQQPSMLPTLPQPGSAAMATGGGSRATTTLGPDQIAALREAASARLAAARAPKPQTQPHRRQPQPQQRRSHQPAPAPAAVGRGREYEPTMPGAAAGGHALRPEQMTQLESLLKSLAQGTSSLPVGTAPVPPAAPATSRVPSADELWSPALLKERNPAAVDALLASSEALLPAQLDRAFAAKRRARARGTAMASRTWFPSPAAWLAGAAPDADPSAAFGQEAEAAEEAPVMQSVAADDAQTQCALSGEKFETFWDDELQQWRYKDARRLDAAEASRYGVQEGAIVLVSALSADQPESTAAVPPAVTADEDGADGAALAAAVQHEAAASETAGGPAEAASPAALPPELASSTAAAAAVAVGNGHSADVDVKVEPEAQDRLPAHTSAAGSTETGSDAALPVAASATAAAPEGLQTALQPSGGVASAAAGGAVQPTVGSKRPLHDGLTAAADGPPLSKVKRETV